MLYFLCVCLKIGVWIEYANDYSHIKFTTIYGWKKLKIIAPISCQNNNITVPISLVFHFLHYLLFS